MQQDKFATVIAWYTNNALTAAGARTVVKQITQSVYAGYGDLIPTSVTIENYYADMHDVCTTLRNKCGDAVQLPYGKVRDILETTFADLPHFAHIESFMRMSLQKTANGSDGTLVHTDAVKGMADAFRRHLESMRNAFQRTLYPLTRLTLPVQIDMTDEIVRILRAAPHVLSPRRIPYSKLAKVAGTTEATIDQLIIAVYLCESPDGLIYRSRRGQNALDLYEAQHQSLSRR